MKDQVATLPVAGWPDQDVWEGRIFVNGWRRGQGHSCVVLDKASGEVIGSVPNSTSEEVQIACESAAQASTSWARTSKEDRARILQRASRQLEEHRAIFKTWLIRESGSTRTEADFEITAAKAHLDFAAEAALRDTTVIDRDDQTLVSYSERVPVGVVGVISPFNFPLVLSLRFVAVAIALGNAVVLKPSQETPISGGVLIASLFQAASLPVGVLQVVPGGAEVGKLIVENQHTDMIAFTGSTRTGREIGSTASGLLKRALLELGGKNPFIVLQNAEVETAAKAGAASTFTHAGQICMAASLHYVHSSLFAEYTTALVQHAQQITAGNPYLSDVAMGPMINEAQLAHVHTLVTECVQSGGRLAEGGTYDGPFYRPTVLTHVPSTSRICTEEAFGPVAVLIPFDDEAQLLEQLNQSEFGLTASVFGSRTRAEGFASQVRSGMVHVNSGTIMAGPRTPFGGLGASGNMTRIDGDETIPMFTTWRWQTERKDKTSDGY